MAAKKKTTKKAVKKVLPKKTAKKTAKKAKQTFMDAPSSDYAKWPVVRPAKETPLYILGKPSPAELRELDMESTPSMPQPKLGFVVAMILSLARTLDRLSTYFFLKTLFTKTKKNMLMSRVYLALDVIAYRSYLVLESLLGRIGYYDNE